MAIEYDTFIGWIVISVFYIASFLVVYLTVTSTSRHEARNLSCRQSFFTLLLVFFVGRAAIVTIWETEIADDSSEGTVSSFWPPVLSHSAPRSTFLTSLRPHSRSASSSE